MEQWEIELNKELAGVYQVKNGYAPNPACNRCRGFGRIHPVLFGKVDYTTTIMCDAPGCLKESFNARGY